MSCILKPRAGRVCKAVSRQTTHTPHTPPPPPHTTTHHHTPPHTTTHTTNTLFTDHSHSTLSHLLLVPPVLSQTSFPFSFWSHCGDQLDCCSQCLAVSFDHFDRSMVQGKESIISLHTPHTVHHTDTTNHTQYTPYTQTTLAHTTQTPHHRHHTLGSTGRQGRGRFVVVRNQTTFCASSTARGTSCGLGKLQEWSITSTPEFPALSPIGEVRTAASSSKAVTSVTDGFHPRHFRFLSEEALGG